MSYTLEVPLRSDDQLDAALAAVEALSPRQIELVDDPPKILAWIDAPPLTFAWPHTVTPAVLLDWESTWSGALRAAPLGLKVSAAGAFGSGVHPTTQMCLDRIIAGSPFRACLDVGTGSGILALAALELGAERAHGTDVDSGALAIARANAEKNGLALTLSEEIPGEQRFDLVVANVLGAALLDLAPALVRALDNGGTLLLSGIRESERAEITRVFVRMGLRHRLDFDRDGWCAVELATSW